jgi:pyruvate kinase
VWTVAIRSDERTCQGLQFSYGVAPVHKTRPPGEWNGHVARWVEAHGLEGDLVVLTQGPSQRHPEANPGMEIIDLGK